MERSHIPAQGGRDRVARIRAMPFLLIGTRRVGRVDTHPGQPTSYTYDDAKLVAVAERGVAVTGCGALIAARHPGLSRRPGS